MYKKDIENEKDKQRVKAKLNPRYNSGSKSRLGNSAKASKARKVGK